MKQNRQTGRIEYLDAMKTVALLLVFALHTQRGSLATEPCHNPILFYAARCCMPLFFMVNGSLILGKQEFSFSYYQKKMMGIMKALFFSGILIGIYVWLVHDFSAWKTAKEILKGFLSYTPYAFLWFFYTFAVIYTILLFGFRWIKEHLRLVTGVLFLSCLLVSFASAYSIANGGFFVQERVTQRFRIWTWLFYFCLGSYLNTLDLKKCNPHLIRILTLVFTFLCMGWQYWICWKVTGQIESNYLYDDCFIIVWSSLVFLSFKVSPEISSFFARFSEYSYGAFLLHGFFVDALQLQSTVHGIWESTLVWIGLCLGCWVLSWLLSKIPVLCNVFRY